MIRDQICKSLTKAIEELGYDGIDIEVLPTTDYKFGDYFTNVALKLAKFESGKNPQEIAKSIIAKLTKESSVFKSDLAENSLINFKICPKFLQTSLRKIIEEENWGFVKTNVGKKARVEFISANPTGPLHIGNARGGPIGDTIANVLEASGYKVLREYLHNDIGGQIENLGKSILNIKKGQDINDQEYAGTYVLDLAKNIEETKDFKKIAKEAVGIMFREIMKDVKDLGIVYDYIQKESDLEATETDKVLNILKNKGMLKEREGAIWFAPKDEYFEDREAVVVKSNGEKTYFANDIAYHNLKFSQGYDLVIDEFGSGHDGHIPKLKSAISALGHDINKFKVVVHQNVRVKKSNETIKMSKRAGNFVTARQVLDEVGKDPFRFYMTMFDPSTHMDFDIVQAKERSTDNPVYYVQYAHARANSILEKAKNQKIRFENFDKVDTNLLNNELEIALMKQLLKLPELVEDISVNLQIHLIPSYIIGVADIFNKFYESKKVIDKDIETAKARLLLVAATKITLRNSLNLLGVSAPDKM